MSAHQAPHHRDRTTQPPARSWGADFIDAEEVRFRLWAPSEPSITLLLDGQEIPMTDLGGGWFEIVTSAQPGMTYSFILSDGLQIADPASRFQRDDVDGPSVLVDPSAFPWQQTGWKGRPLEETVVYELHLGTFTPEGTFAAARHKLAYLRDSGITAIEILPVAQFRGHRGWGYDGVLLYAPHKTYGTPDDFKAFVDDAHAHGLMVFLDVVYNHFGPDGNLLSRYAPAFFHPEERTPWGDAIAYEKKPVRNFFIENALYWLDEYRLDGLRLDAVDQIGDDDSQTHILMEIAHRVRQAYPDRPIHLATEDNRNITSLQERGEGGSVDRYSLEWNDDFHHAAHVIATGETDSYYKDFATDTVAKLARALAQGFIFQGEPSEQDGGKPRGVPSGHLPPTAFLNFIQNHDQIGNRAFGDRLRALGSDDATRALMAVLLLSPQIPLIFMGEEYGEKQPFRFFTDFHGELADSVREGRRKEFAELAGFREGVDGIDDIPDPNALETFEGSKLDWARVESPEGLEWAAFTRKLLSLRQRHIVPLLHRAGPHAGRVLETDEAVVGVEWTFGEDRLSLTANFGTEPKAVSPGDGDVVYSNQTGGSDGMLAPNGVIVVVSKAP